MLRALSAPAVSQGSRGNLMRNLKRWLGSKGIFNPGKVL